MIKGKLSYLCRDLKCAHVAIIVTICTYKRKNYTVFNLGCRLLKFWQSGGEFWACLI